jgi:hypothetical protein
VALTGLVVVVAAGMVLVRPWEDRVTRENFRRLKPRMTRAQVFAIFGPSGDYTTGPIDIGPGRTAVELCKVEDWIEVDYQREITREIWLADGATAVVDFSRSDELLNSYLISEHRVPQTMIENLLWRAKRQWHRWFP